MNDMKDRTGLIRIEHPDVVLDAPFYDPPGLTIDEMLARARAAFEVVMVDYERLLRQVYETEEAA